MSFYFNDWTCDVIDKKFTKYYQKHFEDKVDDDELDYEEALRRTIEAVGGKGEILPSGIDWRNTDTFENKEVALDYIEKKAKNHAPPIGVPFNENGVMRYVVGGWVYEG